MNRYKMVKFVNIHNGEVSFSVQISLKDEKKMSWYETDFFFKKMELILR